MDKRTRRQITFDVEDGFKPKIQLLAARWGMKTNVAMQRSVEQSLARKSTEDEKTLLKLLVVRTEEILRYVHPE